eukprot:10781665-Lingulodinium_polyedra.AAC.1
MAGDGRARRGSRTTGGREVNSADGQRMCNNRKCAHGAQAGGRSTLQMGNGCATNTSVCRADWPY